MPTKNVFVNVIIMVPNSDSLQTNEETSPRPAAGTVITRKDREMTFFAWLIDVHIIPELIIKWHHLMSFWGFSYLAFSPPFSLIHFLS